MTMWNARLSRRELIELVLGASKPGDLNLRRTTGVSVSGDPESIHVFWEHEPRGGIDLPNLIVVPEGADTELLVALNASPQAPAPITALARVITRKEAQELFGGALLDTTGDVLPMTVALAMAEAVLHSEGRLNIRQVTPAVCKRTLSYAWGKALALRAPASAVEKLPSRWVDTYALINTSTSSQSIRATVGSLIGPLGTCAQIGLGIQPPGVVGKLAFACLMKDRLAQERAWQELSRGIDVSLPIDYIASATREERGAHLHRALRAAGPEATDENVFAACAFLATQVAPGSLEHLEVLRTTAHPAVVFWYAIFAALQTPSEILTGNGGVGIRVLRDLSKVEDHIARPTADIAFAELKALERVGIDSLARKFGHVGEVEVELIPLVTSSFSYHSRSSKARSESEGSETSLDLNNNASRREYSTKNRMQKILAQMSDLVQELPDFDDPSRSNAKRGGAIGGRRAKAARDDE